MRLLFLFALLVGPYAGPVLAEPHSFMMMLGNRQIGMLTIDQSGSTTTIMSTMDNTPLGVADGTFVGVTQANGSTVEYEGKSRGSRMRDISFIREASTVTAVTVTPVSEMTELTDAAKVPNNVLSPTEALSALANNGTCPARMVVYDGRRVVQIGTKNATQQGSSVNCDLSYSVVMGPGHLSPFRFRSIDINVTYVASQLRRITVSAGGFRVGLIRE